MAALRSARYFLTNLGSTDALGSRSFVRTVTSYSDPDSPTTSFTAAVGGVRFSVTSNGRGEGRARFKDGEPSLSLSSSAKTSKTQSLSRPSTRSDPLRLRLRLPQGFAMGSSYRGEWSCLSPFSVVPLSLSGISKEKEVDVTIVKRLSHCNMAVSPRSELVKTSFA